MGDINQFHFVMRGKRLPSVSEPGPMYKTYDKDEIINYKCNSKI